MDLLIPVKNFEPVLRHRKARRLKEVNALGNDLLPRPPHEKSPKAIKNSPRNSHETMQFSQKFPLLPIPPPVLSSRPTLRTPFSKKILQRKRECVVNRREYSENWVSKIVDKVRFNY